MTMSTRLPNILKGNALIKDLLEKWNIQFYVMASLCYQMILVILAPRRRWSKSGLVYLVIWSAYLLAGFFSTLALSLINSNAAAKQTTTIDKSDIYPFWAPFLLVHLGGPHTITALAMEDNNFWHRHLLTQMIQVFSVVIVFYQYHILESEWLWPSMIVFVVGMVKCVERIGCLHLASFTFITKFIYRQHQKLNKGGREDNAAAGKEKSCRRLGDGVDKELEIVRKAYNYYKTFKGFIVDHTFTHNECGKGKELFSRLGEEDAFKVMEMELNFMYQAMFTKMIAVQHWEKYYFWTIWRFLCNALLITVLLIFTFHSKHNINPGDINVTYSLLGGAIVLDEIALLHLIFSEWTVVKVMGSADDYNKARRIILRLIYAGKRLCTVNKCWSEKIGQYSLINHSLKTRWKWAESILEFFTIKEAFDSALHTQTVKVKRSLKKLVLEDIRRKYHHPHHQHQQQQEEHATEKNEEHTQNRSDELMRLVDETILPAINKEYQSNYAIFVLTLHIATEICYSLNDRGGGGGEDAELCKQISEYLAYLLACESRITSVVPGSIGMMFKYLCWEQLKHTFNNLHYTFTDKNAGLRSRSSRRKACKYLMDEYRCNDELLQKQYSHEGDESIEKSVVGMAVELARKMNTNYSIVHSDPDVESNTNNNNNNNQDPAAAEFWKSLSRVWAGLLLYASSHCRGDIYYLNRGGEFHTFVRLLMAHFGLQDMLKGERPFQPKDWIY